MATDKKVLAIVIALAAGMFFAGLGAGYGAWGLNPTGPQASTITLSGSTTVLPIGAAAAESYVETRPWLDIQVSGGGSSTGVANGATNQTDIGMSSRDIKASETNSYPNMKVFRIAADGIAIIMNNNTEGMGASPDLTMDQLRGIYNGTYTNWNQVGGSASVAITVVGRDSASGTRAAFDEIVLNNGDPTVDMQQMGSNGLVRSTVINTEGAIGYVGLGYVDDSLVDVISVNGVTPSTTTILDETYPVARSLYFVTGGTPTGIVEDFINFVLGPVGQQIIADVGFVPINTHA